MDVHAHIRIFWVFFSAFSLSRPLARARSSSLSLVRSFSLRQRRRVHRRYSISSSHSYRRHRRRTMHLSIIHSQMKVDGREKKRERERKNGE